MREKLKNTRLSYSEVTICYARNGRRLFQGEIEECPDHLLEYYVTEKITNKVIGRVYLEVVEDTHW